MREWPGLTTRLETVGRAHASCGRCAGGGGTVDRPRGREPPRPRLSSTPAPRDSPERTARRPLWRHDGSRLLAYLMGSARDIARDAKYREWLVRSIHRP